MTISYEYPRKAVMVDTLILCPRANILNLLLIRRDAPPYRNWWALPGGHVEVQETLEEAASRELLEETGVKDAYLEQFHAFSEVKRDPREPTVSVAFFALVQEAKAMPRAGSDAKEVRWFPVANLPRLAFDHDVVIAMGLERMRQQVMSRPIAAGLVPEKFTLGQLRRVYSCLLGREIDKSNFRRDLLKQDLVEELNETLTEVTYRPPKLYRFKRSV